MPQMNWQELLCAKRSRQHVSAAQSDVRTEFRKDYHRIIGSASFRRLQDKTQVYPLNRGDFVRTRLTHSLEVSSFAGSLGDIVFRRLEEQGAQGVDAGTRENCCDILKCAGLVHDIGNPPFGHFGEFAIRQWFGENLPALRFNGIPVTQLLSAQEQGDLLSFEGNAQALRVLTRLHCLIDLDHGMNLTYALLNTIVKYPVSSLGIDKDSGDIKTKKMGFFVSEQELFEDIAASTGAVGCRYPLTFLLESADDIAYKTADIEDAAVKGLITYAALLEELNALPERCGSDAELQFTQQAAQRLSSCLCAARERGLPDPEEKAVQNWMIFVQSKLISAAADAFVDNYKAIMAGEFKRELLAASPARVVSKALSDIAYRYAFRSAGILRTELAADTMMTFLLERITGAALRFDTEQERITDKNLICVMSGNYTEICRSCSKDGSDAQQCRCRLQLATDYVCGMTDGFAQELFRSLSAIS